jgi:WD40 repeat protein
VADPHVYVYNTESGKLLQSLPIPRWQADFLFSPDGTTVIAGAELWRRQAEAPLFNPVGTIEAPSGSGFSPDGSLIAAMGRQGGVTILRLFETATGKQRKVFDLADSQADETVEFRPAFSPSGNSIAFCVYEPQGKVRDVHHDLFSYNPTTGLSSPARYKTTYALRVGLLNLKTSRISYLPNGNEEIHLFCFSADGSRLAAIPKRGQETVRIWEVPSDGPKRK